MVHAVIFTNALFGNGFEFAPFLFFFKKAKSFEQRDVDNGRNGLVVVQDDLNLTGLGFGDGG